MSADITPWPSPRTWRLISEMVEVARLVWEALIQGDHDLLVDCRRWHERLRAALTAERGDR